MSFSLPLPEVRGVCQVLENLIIPPNASMAQLGHVLSPKAVFRLEVALFHAGDNLHHSGPSLGHRMSARQPPTLFWPYAPLDC